MIRPRPPLIPSAHCSSLITNHMEEHDQHMAEAKDMDDLHCGVPPPSLPFALHNHHNIALLVRCTQPLERKYIAENRYSIRMRKSLVIQHPKILPSKTSLSMTP